MKLVEILAEEMEEWPEGVTHLTQSSVDREIYDALDGKPESSVESLKPRFDTRRSHSEDVYPIVIRAQWQAERDKQKGGEWKRHLGGKQPVPDDAVIEYRLRNGDIGDWAPHRLEWDHSGHDGDIMAYRIISQPQAEEVEVKDTNIGTISYKISVDQIAGPLAWRDTIIHCQAIIEDCEREIQRNVDLLDAEGLMMQNDSKKAMQHYALNMQDWRNWKVGDKIRMTASDWSDLTKGVVYEIVENGDDYVTIIDDDQYRRQIEVDGETMLEDGQLIDFEFVSSP